MRDRRLRAVASDGTQTFARRHAGAPGRLDDRSLRSQEASQATRPRGASLCAPDRRGAAAAGAPCRVPWPPRPASGVERRDFLHGTDHVVHAQTFRANLIAVKRTTGCEHRVCFALQHRQIHLPGISFDLKNPGDASLVVYGNQIDLVFAFAVPPGSDLRVEFAFPKLFPKPSFQRSSGEICVLLTKATFQFFKLMSIEKCSFTMNEGIPKGQIRIVQ